MTRCLAAGRNSKQDGEEKDLKDHYFGEILMTKLDNGRVARREVELVFVYFF